MAVIVGIDKATGNQVPIAADPATGALVSTATLSGSVSASTEFEQGAIAGATDKGGVALVVRKDTGGALSGVADGDYSALQIDANGNLRCVLPAGASGLTDTELRATAVTVDVNDRALRDNGSVDLAGINNVDWVDVDSGAGTDNAIPVAIQFPASGGGVVCPGDATNGMKVQGPLTDTELRAADVKVTLDGETVGLAAGTNNIGDVDLASAIPAGDNNIGNVDVVTLPALAAGSNNIGDVDVLSMPTGASAAQTQGDVAHDAGDSGNPIKLGGKALSGRPTAVSANDRVNAWFDLLGQLNTLIRKPVISWASSNGTPITATTTGIIAAPSAGNHLILHRVYVNNGGSTATWIGFRDGASGTQHFRTYLPQGATMAVDIGGSLALTTATRLDIVLSAAGSVEYEVGYETAAD